MNLNEKIIFITGASLGIGREISYCFAKEKCRLVLTYFEHEKEGEEVREECLKLGASEVLLLKLDLNKEEDIKKVVKYIQNKLGKIFILINNAAVISWKSLEKQSFKEINEQVEINLLGTIKLTKLSVPLIEYGILNMLSVSGLISDNRQIIYSSTKWGLRGFTKALAKEYPALKIYSFVCGGVATRMKNFEGISPEKPAQLILTFFKEDFSLESGSEIDAINYPMFMNND
jgi:short-subunit dehydrogenase